MHVAALVPQEKLAEKRLITTLVVALPIVLCIMPELEWQYPDNYYTHYYVWFTKTPLTHVCGQVLASI